MKLITFRPKQDESEAFETALLQLGVKRTELARWCFREGYAIAVKTIAEKKRRPPQDF